MAITTVILKNSDVPSMNILLRMHWTKRAKMLEQIQWKIRSQTVSRHPGKVRIVFHRFAVKLMDWDNYAGAFKFIGDALHGNKIIVDDKPAIVVEFIPKQTQVDTLKQQKILLTIEDII